MTRRTDPESPPVFLFDLDGTLLEDRTVLHLADAFDVREALEEIWDAHRGSQELAAGEAETLKVASLLKGVPEERFEETIRQVPFRRGAPQTVARLKRMGFEVGVASASYQAAVERARNELGLDFSLGVELERDRGVLTGGVSSEPIGGPCGQWVCKERVLREWKGALGAPFAVAMGDGLNDVCLLEEADLGLAIEPCPSRLKHVADHVVSELVVVPGTVAAFLEDQPAPSEA